MVAVTCRKTRLPKAQVCLGPSGQHSQRGHKEHAGKPMEGVVAVCTGSALRMGLRLWRQRRSLANVACTQMLVSAIQQLKDALAFLEALPGLVFLLLGRGALLLACCHDLAEGIHDFIVRHPHPLPKLLPM